MKNKTWSELIKNYKSFLVIIIIGFFLIEVEIFAFAVMKSGRQSFMQVLNDSNDVIYEVKGATMTNFNKYYFENTFGPFEEYHVRIETKETAFPFRAWFSAAVGLPVGLVLLLAFILKAVMVFLHGKDEQIMDDKSKKSESDSKNGIEKLLFRISSYNIFIIGFLVFASVFLFWIIPNLLTFLVQTGIETIMTFKWVFLGGFIAFFLLFTWFMYMKYQLAKQSMESQVEIKKYELELEYTKAGLNKLPELGLERDVTVKMIEHSETGFDDKDDKEIKNSHEDNCNS